MEGITQTVASANRRLNLLLVEDELDQPRTAADTLRDCGFRISTAVDAPKAIEHVSRFAVDLIVIDLSPPSFDGFALLQALRDRRAMAPILVLATPERTTEPIPTLRRGTDDYLVKPVDQDALLERLTCLLRRSHPSGGPRERPPMLHGIEVDFRRNEVLRDGEWRALSNKEAGLFRHLLHNAGRTVSRAELLEQVWGYHQDVSSRTVDVHMVSLRRKVERDPRQPQRLLTVHGQGYKLVPDEF